MPYSRPSQYPDFCLTGTRAIPPNGEISTGYLPDQIPPCEEHNFLFGTAGDWIRWLDQITANAALFPVSNAGHSVALATNLQGQLDQLDSAFASLGFAHEVPTGLVNGVNDTFQLSQVPINVNSVAVFVDGLESDPSEYSVQLISGQWYVVFAGGSIPASGQTPNVVYMTGASGVGTGAGGLPQTHGSDASPIAITPAVGILATNAAFQVWWVQPASGTGAVPITAAAAIAAGTLIGQRLIVKSKASANYLVIPNGAGTDQASNCSMGPAGQSIQYTWDGLKWSEDSRRF